MLNLTIVLDIDETLIHSSGSTQDENRDFFCLGYDVYKRPHLDEFLKFVFDNFSVGFFTSAKLDYTTIILDNILTKEQRKKTRFVYDRKFCNIVKEKTYSIYEQGGAEYKVYKNLKKVFYLSGVSRKKTIAIDDKPYSFFKSYSNCIPIVPFLPISSFYRGDTELLKLMEYIKIVSKTDNVRKFDHRSWTDKIFLTFPTKI